ncbi:MAG TPA: phage baseplate assembly protein V [Pyrinomonadaceae bacterium]|nr:phage baseplate assembly protein V [Pyrinomonadaceae bacterium]
MSAPARSRTTDKRYYGVVEAIVTDNNDPNKEGRVKVQFPWFDEQMETEWCRLRQLYAGNDYGTFFVPEVGDEVLVAFIHGDMRQPIILGGLYNGKDKPPSFHAKDKDQKMIRTKGKHEILLDDTNDQQRVRIKTNGGHMADLSDVDKKITIQSSGNHSITLDDQGKKATMKTSGGPKVEIDDAAKKITIDANGKSVVIDGNSGTITLTGMTIVLSGTSVKLGGDGATQSLVLGELFMLAFNTHTHLCTAPGTPSAPPLPPMTPAQLSTISKTT